MTRDEMVDVFQKDTSDEFLKFDRVENKLSQRTDLHAFLLLDKLVPDKRDIVGGACHDEIYLGIDSRKLAEVVTRDQLIELIRCGVRWSDESDSLCMFA